MFVIEEELVTGLPNVTVVLVNPENPGNVGFATRAMANFGVSKLRIVGSDPRQDQLAQIFSVHASEMLDAAEVFDNLESALEDMEASWGATARSGSNHSVTRALVPLPELPNPASREGEVALVFGRESIGLTNEEIALCDLAFGIPTDQSELYVRYGIKPERRPTDARAANREERAQVCVFYNEIVDETTIKDFRKPIAKQVFRNLVGRSYMTGRELATLTGTIRKFKQLIDRNSEKD
ncbi:MAG: RNA methyltransferase [Candidatus Thorarchaeota archaeon]